DERLHCAHHLEMSVVVNGAGTGPRLERAIEYCQVQVGKMWRALDGLVFVEVLDDFLDLARVVTNPLQRARYGAVDDLQHPAAYQLLVFDERDVGLDAGGVAIHHEGNCSGRRDNGCLRVAKAALLADLERIVPGIARRSQQVEWNICRLQLVGMAAMLLDDFEHWFAIRRIARERTHLTRDPCGLQISLAG